ncbi:MAG: hypothetical protein Fur005_10370 [Roseiflexaceae bacterium]
MSIEVPRDGIQAEWLDPATRQDAALGMVKDLGRIGSDVSAWNDADRGCNCGWGDGND